ncbi:MAG: MlaE family lipid ABC transporter permease subunit [Phyllobacteriaceae bacterium]|nr:MlaE family lipid ABC transporter permease subunit [Phyllobacteriaceae bacterium]
MRASAGAQPWTPSTPSFLLEEAAGVASVRLSGDWTIRTVGPIEQSFAAFRRAVDAVAATAETIVVDLGGVGRVDTAGALLLHRMVGPLPDERRRVVGLDETRRTLFEEVERADRPPAAPTLGPGPVIGFLVDLGRWGTGLAAEAMSVLTLLGGATTVMLQAIRRPSRLRFVPFVHQLQRTALDAVPIIVLMSFLIGCIIAQQGAFYFRRFGADIYVVDMVGVLTLREIAVILTAVMVAGRSGSAFTAELGSMRMREEVDALKVTGLDPIEILVVPRLAALMLALPILTFLSDIASILGAAIVCNIYADIPTATFLYRLHAAVEMRTFLVGVCKAPFMALIIALIACMEGLSVEGSAESLGRRTTMAVVKSIFMVIVVDGIFAMFYAAAGV